MTRIRTVIEKIDNYILNTPIKHEYKFQLIELKKHIQMVVDQMM